jgi:hypothetical protein
MKTHRRALQYVGHPPMNSTRAGRARKWHPPRWRPSGKSEGPYPNQPVGEPVPQPFATTPYVLEETELPRVLLIFVGLLRTMEVTFPALRHSFIRPNEHAFTFHAVIATDRDSRCSKKETTCCLQPVEESAYPWAKWSAEEMLSRARKTYHPYLLHGGIVGRDIFFEPRPVDSFSQPSRLRPVFEALDLATFQVALVARPDAVFVQSNQQLAWMERLSPMDMIQEMATMRISAQSSAPGLGRLPEIRLESECAVRSGLSVVEGSFAHGNDGSALDRDHDFMLLACTPAALLSWFYATSFNQTSCVGGSCASNVGWKRCDEIDRRCTASPPLVPRELAQAGLRRTRLKCSGGGSGHQFCSILAQFHRNAHRLGTMDGIYAGLLRRYEGLRPCRRQCGNYEVQPHSSCQTGTPYCTNQSTQSQVDAGACHLAGSLRETPHLRPTSPKGMRGVSSTPKEYTRLKFRSPRGPHLQQHVQQ